MNLELKDYFKYHPPITDERIMAHDVINNMCYSLALEIDTLVIDEDCKKMAIFALQQCRMFSNQGITITELNKIRKNES